MRKGTLSQGDNNMNISRYIAIALLSLMPGVALAQANAGSDPAGLGGLAQEAESQVSVSADKLDVLELERQAVYSGNVMLIQGTMTLKAPKLVAHYGEKGMSDLKSFETMGGRVEMVFDAQTVHADTSAYDFAQRIMVFGGKVEVVNESGTVKADRLTVDTRAGTSSFSTTSGGRVTSVFNTSAQ